MLSSIINLGTDSQSSTKALKIKITNLVSCITALIAFCYAMFFYFELQLPSITLMNLVFVAGYCITLVMSHLKLIKQAKLWFFITLMMHVFLLSTLIFSSESYFHLYYLIIPTGIFVLFEEDEMHEKIGVMLLAVVLFFAAVNYQEPPLIEIAPKTAELILISTVTVIMIETFIVMSWFNRLVHRYQVRLMDMATKDALTGINNRRTFISEAESMMAHSQRYETKLSLIIMDIDFFKRINDEEGHLAGDYILKKVANVLEMNSRASDRLARYGGEEFVMLLPEANLQQAMDTAEHLRQTIANHMFIYQGDSISVTMSFGVTERLVHDTEVNELIKRADSALYQAKRTGRNQVIAS